MVNRTLSNRPPAAFIAFAAVLHALFFAYACLYGNPYFGNECTDAWEYLAQARNIVAHGSWYAGDMDAPLQPELHSLRPPAYGLFIAAAKAVWNNDLVLLLFQNILSLANLLGIWLLAVRYLARFPIPSSVTTSASPIFKSSNLPIFQLIFFTSLLFFPSQLIYANVIMSEMLFQTFLFWAFFCFVRYTENRKGRLLVLYNVLLSLAILTKPVLYWFWIPNVFIMLYAVRCRREASRRYGLFGGILSSLPLSALRAPIAIGAILPALTVLTVCLHNQQTTGYFHYSSIKTYNLLKYNTYLTLAEAQGAGKADSIYAGLRDSLDRLPGLAERSAFIEERCTDILLDHLPTYAWLEMKGVMKFFLDPSRWDIYAFLELPISEQGIARHYERGGVAVVTDYLLSFPAWILAYAPLNLLVNLAMLAAFISFLRDRNYDAALRLFVAVMILYIAVVTGPLAAGRFRMPLWPLMLFCLLIRWPYLAGALRRLSFKNS